MIQRGFDIPDQHAIHGISIDNLMNSFPDVIGKAKAVNDFKSGPGGITNVESLSLYV